MKSKVEQYAKGDYYVDYPRIKVSKSYLQLKIEADSQYTGKIEVESENGVPMKMMVYDDAYLLNFEDHGMIGKRGEILFSFDGHGKKRGSIYEGNIHLIGNGMEKEIPYSIEIVAPFFHVSEGALEDLMKFSALAESDWEKALQIYRSEAFVSTLLADNNDYQTAYASLKDSPNQDQAMEEFLVYIHKKRALTLQWEHDRFQFRYPKMKERHQITIHKNTWGYCRIQVRTDAGFIELEQTEITNEDFDSDNAVIYYTLDPNKMDKNENVIGHIILENSLQNLTASILVQKPEEPSRILVRTERDDHGRKQEVAALVHHYLNYRIGKISLNEFIDRSRQTLGQLISYEPENGLYKLGMLHMSVLSGAEDKVKEELRRMEADLDEAMQGSREHCYFLYLKALVSKDAEQIEEACREIEEAMTTEEDKLFYFWLLIYSNKRYQKDKQLFYSQIEALYKGGFCSPVLALEICDLINSDPVLLRKLSVLELAAVNFGIRNRYLNEETEREFLQLVDREKEFHPQIFSLLSRIYEQRSNPEIIKTICSMLVKGGKTERMYHSYYKEGIKCGFRIVGIQENFLRSMDRNNYERIPEAVLRYFNYKGILTESEYAYLYANVIINKRSYLGIYDEYLPNMEAFMDEQIIKGNMSDDLTILYSELLRPQTVRASFAPSLVKVIFKRKLTVLNDNIIAVVVTHKELEGETLVPVTDHVAFVDMITESAVITLIDREHNRFVSTVPYKLQKLVDESLYMEILKQFAAEDYRYVLYRYNLLEAYDATGAKEVNVSRDLLSFSQISKETKQQAIYGIVRYYYEHLDTKILANYLERVDKEYIPAADAADYVNYLLTCGLYEKAFDAIKRFGYQGVLVENLIKLVESLKEFSGYAKEESLISVAAYLYRMGQETPEILSYLVDHYQSGLKDMVKLWKRASGRLSRLDMLEENIICETLYTEQWYDDVYRIFSDYIRKKRSGMVIKAFFKRAAFAYLVEEKEIPVTFFDALFYQIGEVGLEDDICLAAMLLFFSRKSKLEPEEISWIREKTEIFLKRGILLPFFRNFKKYMNLPKDLFFFTYVVVKDKAGKTINFRYGIQAGNEKSESNKTARMMEILPGYYIKEFVLFHGENLLYEMPKDEAGHVYVFESEGMKAKGETEEYENRFEMLNAMLLNQEMGENQMVLNKINHYLKLSAIVEENLELME